MEICSSNLCGMILISLSSNHEPLDRSCKSHRNALVKKCGNRVLSTSIITSLTHLSAAFKTLDSIKIEMSGMLFLMLFINGCSDQAYVGGENGQRGC